MTSRLDEVHSAVQEADHDLIEAENGLGGRCARSYAIRLRQQLLSNGVDSVADMMISPKVRESALRAAQSMIDSNKPRYQAQGLRLLDAMQRRQIEMIRELTRLASLDVNSPIDPTIDTEPHTGNTGHRPTLEAAVSRQLPSTTVSTNATE